MHKNKYRVAVINSHPIQYFAPLYKFINQNSDIELTALYLSDFSIRGAKDVGFGHEVKWDIDLLEGYPHKFIGSRSHTRTLGGFRSIIAPEICHALWKGKYDAVIVHGYAFAANLVAIASARALGIPVLMRAETHLGLSYVSTTGFKSKLRKLIFSQCSGFLAIGSANRDYYLKMGIAADKVFLMPYSVDIERFSNRSGEHRKSKSALRESIGIFDDLPIILYASKFQSRKHPDEVLRATALLGSEGLRFHVLMVGSGDLELELRDLADQLKIDRVTFPGFVNQSRLPEIYAACDVFVLPSEDEPWGLVVNEAMASGLAVVTTPNVGCVPDLILGHDAGTVSKSFRAVDLANALRPILEDAQLRQSMSSAAVERISKWGYRQATDGLCEALNAIL